MLSQGSRGQDVKELQSCLNNVINPQPQLQVDGIFGPKTKQAVIQFQQQHGNLRVDGIVGPQTMKALREYCPAC